MQPTFGASYAVKLKRRRPKLGDKWFLNKVFLKSNGVQHYLWRAVDQTGAVIDILVQPKGCGDLILCQLAATNGGIGKLGLWRRQWPEVNSVCG